MEASDDPHSNAEQPNLRIGIAPSLSVDGLMQSIERLQSQTQTLEEDAGARMQQVESIQDELIQQLDELNDCVQKYIDSLVANRQSSTSENRTESSPVKRVA